MTTEKKFWASSDATAKRAYIFVLTIGKNFSDTGSQVQNFEKWVVQKVTRPSFSISEATHSYLNHTFYFPGRLTWNEVSFSVVDAVNPDSTALLMGMLASSGYRFPKNKSDKADLSTISKATSTIACTFSAIDAEGTEIDKWTLKNAWITSTDLGEFDYTSDDLMSITVNLRYDYAEYELMPAAASNLNNPARDFAATFKPGN